MTRTTPGPGPIGRRRLLQYAAGAAAAAALAPLAGCSSAGDDPVVSPGRRRNLLVLYADDQRYDTVRFMPTLLGLMRTHGTTFTQGRQSSPQCTPSRATMLTGRLATGPDGHGVDKNFKQLRAEALGDTLAPWLQAAGYHCGLAGKYLDLDPSPPVPPGWAWWRSIGPEETDDPFPGQDARSYSVFDGRSKVTPDAHQMDHLTGLVTEFVETAPEPWFLWDCPTSPHYPPQPTPRRADAPTDDRWPVVGDDTTGKPSWIGSQARRSEPELADARAEIAEMLREVIDLDDHLAAVWASLQASGRAERTTILYTSDNGIALLDHRLPLLAKNLPYDVSSHVPLVCIGAGFEPGAVVDAPVSVAVDVTATCLAVADAQATAPQVGVDLARVAADPGAFAGRAVRGSCVEQAHARFDIPTSDWVVTDLGQGLRKLIRYADTSGTDQYEAYDLDDDPDELVSWANDPARRPERDALEAALDAEIG